MRRRLLRVAICVAVPGVAVAAPSQQTIYSFTIGADGGRPRAGMIMDGAGALYGTTVAGGNTAVCYRTPGCGVVFKLTPPAAGQSVASETAIYTFAGGSDGVAPVGGLLMDGAGALYGTASQGGAGGYGVVFKLTPPASGSGAWTETTLFGFTGRKDGGTPLGTLVADAQGALYGTTQNGGAAGFGVVFKLTPQKKGFVETVLHAFQGRRMAGRRWRGLAIDGAGVLYGTTPLYGAHQFGVAFSLTPPAASAGRWKARVLHAFANGADGSYPMGSLLLAGDGGLFGTTSSVGRMRPGWGWCSNLQRRRRGKRIGTSMCCSISMDSIRRRRIPRVHWRWMRRGRCMARRWLVGRADGGAV